MVRVLTAILLTFFAGNLVPLQAQNREILFNEFISSLTEKINNEESLDALIQYYINIYDQPININDCHAEELISLNILQRKQIRKILKVRDKIGGFKSLYELITLADISEEVFDQLFPFLLVESNNNSFAVSPSGQAIQRIKFFPSSKPNENIIGGPFDLRHKINLQYGKLSSGLSLKKEYGEPLIWEPKQQWYLYDHISGFMRFRTLNKRVDIVVGNFTLNGASGLLFGQTFASSKSINPTLFGLKPQIGAQPFSSFSEQYALKGMALNISAGNFSISPYLSYRNISANINKTENTISSIRSNYQRTTETSLNSRQNSSMLETGFTAHYGLQVKDTPVGVGVNWAGTYFKNSIQYKPQYYARTIPEKENQAGSIYLISNPGGFKLWSEIAINHKRAISMIAGMMTNLSSKLELLILYRKLSSGFYTFQSNPPSHSSSNLNEEGFYIGMKLIESKSITVSGYSDLFWSKLPRYLIKKASYQTDNKLIGEFHLGEESILQGWLRVRSLTRTVDSNSPLQQYQQIKQREATITYIYDNQKQYKTKTRIGYKKSSNISEAGSYIFHQVGLDFKSKLKTLFRFTLFQAQDFINRLYVYENDLTYNFNTRLLYGNGYSFFILMKKAFFSHHLKMELKWNVTTYFDRSKVQTNIYSFNRPVRHELSFQCIYKL